MSETTTVVRCGQCGRTGCALEIGPHVSHSNVDCARISELEQRVTDLQGANTREVLARREAEQQIAERDGILASMHGEIADAIDGGMRDRARALRGWTAMIGEVRNLREALAADRNPIDGPEREPVTADSEGQPRTDEASRPLIAAAEDKARQQSERIASLKSQLSRLRDGLRELARGCCILKDGEGFCDERGCGHSVARKLLAETNPAPPEVRDEEVGS